MLPNTVGQWVAGIRSPSAIGEGHASHCTPFKRKQARQVVVGRPLNGIIFIKLSSGMYGENTESFGDDELHTRVKPFKVKISRWQERTFLLRQAGTLVFPVGGKGRSQRPLGVERFLRNSKIFD